MKGKINGLYNGNNIIPKSETKSEMTLSEFKEIAKNLYIAQWKAKNLYLSAKSQYDNFIRKTIGINKRDLAKNDISN